MKNKLKFISILFLILLFGRCSDSEKEVAEDITEISILNVDDNGVISIEKGTSIQVTTNIPSENNSRSLVFESGYTSVFAVDKNGLITTLNDGEGTLTIKTQRNFKVQKSCKISVFTKPVPTKNLLFSDATNGVIEIFMEQTKKVKVAFDPANVTNKALAFESKDPSIFTVDNQGNIKGILAGESTLTVKSLDGSETVASCKIRVNKVLVGNIKIENTSMTLGSSLDISKLMTINPVNAVNKEVTYKSSSPNIATVDQNGIVTALNTGEVSIIATAKDGSNIAGKAKVKIGNAYTALNRSGFTVKCSSEKESDGGGRNMILNDDYHKYWHSSWSPDFPLPHWLMITMDKPYVISKILVARRQKDDGSTNTDTKNVVIEVSADNISYIPLGQINFGDNSQQELEKSLEFYPLTVKYIKLTVDASNRAPFANISIVRPYVLE